MASAKRSRHVLQPLPICRIVLLAVAFGLDSFRSIPTASSGSSAPETGCSTGNGMVLADGSHVSWTEAV
jgi:hypothetical protein